MTIAKTITLARQHLKNGNRQGYMRIMEGAIRAAKSTRTANIYRAAMAEVA